MSATRISSHINAPRAAVYRALLDARAVAKWKVPDETTEPALRCEMTITLADRDGGTDLLAVHEGLPPGVSPADNEVGWQMALAKLAALVEVGWRLARPYWRQGYATEGARAALRVGFEGLGLAEIVSFTSVLNSRSRAVMERIGMRNAHEDFEYRGVPENHSLRPHCLYRIT